MSGILAQSRLKNPFTYTCFAKPCSVSTGLDIHGANEPEKNETRQHSQGEKGMNDNYEDQARKDLKHPLCNRNERQTDSLLMYPYQKR